MLEFDHYIAVKLCAPFIKFKRFLAFILILIIEKCSCCIINRLKQEQFENFICLKKRFLEFLVFLLDSFFNKILKMKLRKDKKRCGSHNHDDNTSRFTLINFIFNIFFKENYPIEILRNLRISFLNK